MTLPATSSVARLEPAAGGLPKLTLLAPDGACAEVYPYGAHVVSWVPAREHESPAREHLFLSRTSAFRPGAPIRGGIPVVFPQFGMAGPLPLHGLVRLMTWELASADTAGSGAVARFRVTDTPESREQWNHAFEAELVVEIGGNQLSVTLGVTNTGAEAFDFTGAFHTYLAIDEIAETAVVGLAGLTYRDAAAGGAELQDDAALVDFRGEVNRIYFDAPVEAHLEEKDRTTVVQKAGFPDVVVWNPGASKCATMADLEPEDYRRFVCVEAAAVRTLIYLAPGATWQGRQTVMA